MRPQQSRFSSQSAERRIAVKVQDGVKVVDNQCVLRTLEQEQVEPLDP